MINELCRWSAGFGRLGIFARYVVHTNCWFKVERAGRIGQMISISEPLPA